MASAFTDKVLAEVAARNPAESKGKSDGEVMRFCQSFVSELLRCGDLAL
jgi:hypothetical protein